MGNGKGAAAREGGKGAGAGGDSDAAVPHNVVIEENVVFLTYKCYDFYLSSP